MSDTRWPKATRERPCPKCGKWNRCKIAPDSMAGICWRSGSSEPWHDGNGTPGPASTSYIGKAHRPHTIGKAQTYATAEDAIRAVGRTIAGGTLAAAYPYFGRDGMEVMRPARFDLADGGKEFRPVHRIASGAWKVGDPVGPLPLYRLNELPADGPIYVCEGEKAADAARAIGLPATTSAHGSSAAANSDWTPLAGRDVVILPDCDEPGTKYARDVAAIVVRLGARVRIIELPGLRDGGDIVEYIAAMPGESPEAVASSIIALADAVPWIDPAELIGGPVMVCLADVEPKSIAWLWEGKYPLGRISLLVGRPGEGKSFVTIDATARVTTGTPWPDGSECPQGSVILICAEDDPGDTIRPRLDACYADVHRVHLLSMVRRPTADGMREVLFTLADVAALEMALRRVPDCKLIVIDPIGSFLGGDTDAHRDNEVRGVLAPVAKLAEKYGPAVLIVAHRRKSSGDVADDLALGSRAFTGIARSVLHLSRDSENPRRRLLLPGKNNLAPEGDGMAFTIAGDPPRIEWEREPVKMSADDALAVENAGDGPGRPAEERDDATEWLRAELADLAEHPVADLKKAANEAGINWRTVQRAAAPLRVIRHRSGFGAGFIWRLPKPGTMPAPNRANHTCHNTENENLGTNGTNGELSEKRGISATADVPERHTCQNVYLGTNGENGHPEDDYETAEREALASGER